MKKLVIACLLVGLVGCALKIGGAAMGGELYSVYYDGRLHSAREAAKDGADYLRGAARELPDRTEDFFDGWADDYTVRRRNAVDDALYRTANNLPSVSVDWIDGLDLRLTGGTFRIEGGGDFDVSDPSAITRSEYADGEWRLRLSSAGDEPVAITLPAKDVRYDEIFISAHDCGLTVDAALEAEEFALALVGATADISSVGSPDIDLNVSDGTLLASLTGRAEDFHVEAKTSGGAILFNGEVLAGGTSGILHAERGTGELPYELDLKAESASITITAN